MTTNNPPLALTGAQLTAIINAAAGLARALPR
jgi:hypothetical protein